MVVLGTGTLVGLYFALPYLSRMTQKDTSDAGAVGTTLRIGMDNWVGYVPLCSKELRRQMRSAGFLVQCEDDNADTAARMKRLREGSLEFAVATVDSLLLNGPREKFPGTIVLVIDESSGGDAIVARKDKVASLQDAQDALRLQDRVHARVAERTPVENGCGAFRRPGAARPQRCLARPGQGFPGCAQAAPGRQGGRGGAVGAGRLARPRRQGDAQAARHGSDQAADRGRAAGRPGVLAHQRRGGQAADRQLFPHPEAFSRQSRGAGRRSEAGRPRR